MEKCEWCGKKIARTPAQVRKSKGRFFCGRECRNKWANSVMWVYPKSSHDVSIQRKLKSMAINKPKKKGFRDEKMELFLRRRE